jgi:hypothetical protein
MVFNESTTITTVITVIITIRIIIAAIIVIIITIILQDMSDFVMVLANSTIMAVLMVVVYKKYVEKAENPDTDGLRRQLDRYIAVADTSAAENAKLKLSLKAAEAQTVKAEAKAKASLAEVTASPTEVVFGVICGLSCLFLSSLVFFSLVWSCLVLCHFVLL